MPCLLFFSADDRMKYYVTILLMVWERVERQEVGWRRREVTECGKGPVGSGVGGTSGHGWMQESSGW